MMDWIALLELGVRHAAPILLIAMGCLLAQKVSIFNLALEGFTLFACFFAVVGAYMFKNVWMGVLCGILAGVLTSIIYSVFILQLQVNPVICALSINTLVTGLTRYLLKPIFNTSGRFVMPSALALPTIHIGLLDGFAAGEVLNDKSSLVYLSLLLPFILYFVLFHTEFGLNMRITGLNEEAALAAGVNTKKVKYTALLLNGALCGLAGAELALSVYMFNVGMTNGRGFTALAAVTLGGAHPLVALGTCMLFGISESLSIQLSTSGFSAYLLGAIPYAMALTAALLPGIIRLVSNNMKKRNAERQAVEFYDN